MKQFTIQQNDVGKRLDVFLKKIAPNLPLSLLYSSIRKKNIKCNKKRVARDYRLQLGDEITVFLSDEVLAPKPITLSFLSASTDIVVVYEDENILVVDKPKGVLTHPAYQHTSGTLVDQVRHYLYETKAYDPSQEQSFAPASVNRLDRNTGGLVLFAKTACALRYLSEKMQSQEIVKRYLCVCVNAPPKEHDTVISYHKKDQQQEKAILVSAPTIDTKQAVTEYRTLEKYDQLSLVEVTLHTGRFHQIRVQLAALGAPILGDGKYGNIARNKQYGVFSQMLLAYQLQFAFSNPEDVDASLSNLNGKTFCADHENLLTALKTLSPMAWGSTLLCK